MNIQIVVSCVVTPCSDGVGYQISQHLAAPIYRTKLVGLEVEIFIEQGVQEGVHSFQIPHHPSPLPTRPDETLPTQFLYYIYAPPKIPSLHTEDGRSMNLRNVGILPHHYKAS
jgi:hypothetical protein